MALKFMTCMNENENRSEHARVNMPREERAHLHSGSNEALEWLDPFDDRVSQWNEHQGRTDDGENSSGKASCESWRLMEWKTEPENEQQDNETSNNKLVTLLHLRLPLPRLLSLWPGRRGSFLALCHRAPVHPPPPWSLRRIAT